MKTKHKWRGSEQGGAWWLCLTWSNPQKPASWLSHTVSKWIELAVKNTASHMATLQTGNTKMPHTASLETYLLFSDKFLPRQFIYSHKDYTHSHTRTFLNTNCTRTRWNTLSLKSNDIRLQQTQYDKQSKRLSEVCLYYGSSSQFPPQFHSTHLDVFRWLDLHTQFRHGLPTPL